MSEPVFSLETIDAAVSRVRTAGWPIGRSPMVVHVGQTVRVQAWDGRLILETTRAGWDEMLSGSRRPTSEAAARFNAALARDFYSGSLHGGFWWPA